MNNLAENDVLSIISKWTYESPDNTIFDRNIESMTLSDEKDPLKIEVEKMATTQQYRCSISRKNGNAYIEPMTMSVSEFTNQHIALTDEEGVRGLTIYLKRRSIWKIIYFDKGYGDDAIFIDFASDHPSFTDSPRPSPELLYEVGSHSYNNGEKGRGIGLFNAALNAGLYVSPCLVQIGIFSVENGDYSNAHHFFIQAIASDTKNSAAYYNLATLQLKVGRSDEARQNLIKAADLGNETAKQLLQ